MIRIKLIFLEILTFVRISYGQQNLVPNYSFEYVYSSYYTYSVPSLFYSDENISDNKNYWDNIQNWTYPDNIFPCFQVGSADVLPASLQGFDPHTGDKHGHGTPWEYLIVKLTTPLSVNNFYYIEFYKYMDSESGSNQSDFNVGMRFFQGRPKQHYCLSQGDWLKPINGNTDCRIPIGNYSDGWHRFSFVYKPNENYDYLALGNHGNWSASNGYWDDIKIYDLGPMQCPLDYLFENITYENENRIFQVSNSIYAGFSVDPNNFDGNVIVDQNSSITYRAGNQITLEPGFTTEPGSYFEAVIGPCEENPCPLPPSLPQNYELCSITSTTLGPTTPPDVGLLYSWSPATYLDNPNSPNPVFTAPPGEGTINYTLTVSSACGYLLSSFFTIDQELTYPVSIYYNDNPDPNPSLTLSNIQQSHLNFSFDAMVGPNTEKICVSLTDLSNGQIIAMECFYTDSDFSCCSLTFSRFDFSYETQLLIDPCKDYLVTADVNNKCDENIASESFLWNNSESFQLVTLPNVITPNSDGNNDSWLIDAEGVKSWELTISDNNNPVFSSSGIVNSYQFRIWDGNCNQGFFCNQNNPCLNDGTYFYVLKLFDCNSVAHDYSGFITVLDATNSGCLNPRTMDNSNLQALGSTHEEVYLSTLDDETINERPVLFPNPSDGVVTVQNLLPNSEIRIFDISGRLVYSSNNLTENQTTLDLVYLAQGHYWLEIKNKEEQRAVLRWIKQ